MIAGTGRAGHRFVEKWCHSSCTEPRRGISGCIEGGYCPVHSAKLLQPERQLAEIRTKGAPPTAPLMPPNDVCIKQQHQNRAHDDMRRRHLRRRFRCVRGNLERRTYSDRKASTTSAVREFSAVLRQSCAESRWSEQRHARPTAPRRLAESVEQRVVSRVRQRRSGASLRKPTAAAG